MNEPRFLKANPRTPVDQRPYDAFEPNSYEAKGLTETPHVVNMLGIGLDYKVDDSVRVMAHGVDEMVRDVMEEEHMRDSQVSYETVLNRYLSKLPDSVERMVTAKRGLEILDFLFKEASLQEELSAKTYKEVLREKYKRGRVSRLLSELEGSLPKRVISKA